MKPVSHYSSSDKKKMLSSSTNNLKRRPSFYTPPPPNYSTNNADTGCKKLAINPTTPPLSISPEVSQNAPRKAVRAMEIAPAPVEHFIPNFLPRFGGYSCYFLKKDNYETLKFFSSKISLTKNNYVCVFRMPDIIRRRLYNTVERVLQTVVQCNAAAASGSLIVSTQNPFKWGQGKPVCFLGIGEDTKFFEQPIDVYNAQRLEKNPMQHGKSYHARIAVVLKGAKLDAAGVVSPMLKLIQVMIMPSPPLPKDENLQCLLEEPVDDEDAMEVHVEDGDLDAAAVRLIDEMSV